jgi:hypothetical protein
MVAQQKKNHLGGNEEYHRQARTMELGNKVIRKMLSLNINRPK